MKYIVFSNYVNAWTIKRGLKILGKNLDVYSREYKRNVIDHTINDIPKDSTLFFTEENNLKKYIDSDSYRLFPRSFPKGLLDDKFNFAEFLGRINEDPIPYTDTDSYLNYPFFLKAKHSWKDDQKLPRGFICEDKDDFHSSIEILRNKGLNRKWFFKQKLLTSPIENNISTSGFFDYNNNNRNIIIVTKKAYGDEKKIATGVAIETITDPNNLIKRTTNILNKLCYTGPFELEFFNEVNDSKYYVLELNPRFWMQHGIFLDYYDNAILKRYLELDLPSDWVEDGIAEFKKIIWIDNLFYIKSLFKGDIEVINGIKNLKGEKTYYPNVRSSLRFYMNSAIDKMRKRN